MDFADARKQMIKQQLLPRGIGDHKVLKAFGDVERHCFVPPVSLADAYEDYPLSIGYGQTISQPYIVALMTQSLQLKGGEKVLEIGTGSGYQAAILAELCDQVYTVEREENLFTQAEKTLLEQGYKNIKFRCGDGTKGWEEEAPFEGIIVTAGAPSVPQALKEQLAEGGRLVIPVGTMYGQMLKVIEKKGNNFCQEDICGCVFVPLIGEDGWQG